MTLPRERHESESSIRSVDERDGRERADGQERQAHRLERREDVEGGRGIDCAGRLAERSGAPRDRDCVAASGG